MVSKITENYITFDNNEKDKSLQTSNVVTKSLKIFGFSLMCKTWGRIRVWIGIKMRIRIRIRTGIE
jgi:hypothetical protein